MHPKPDPRDKAKSFKTCSEEVPKEPPPRGQRVQHLFDDERGRSITETHGPEKPRR